MSSRDVALRKLSSLPVEDQLAALEILEQKRRKEHFARYWQATPAQAQALKRVPWDRIKLLGLLGGNRSGKSECSMFLATAWLLGKSYFRDEPTWELVKDLPIPEGRPRNIWVTALDFNILNDVLMEEKLITGRNHPGFIPHNDENWITKVSLHEHKIWAADGSVLTGKSADSGRSKFQAASIDLAVCDEECEREIFDEIYQRTVDCSGKIVLSLTPLNDIASAVREPWVYNLYQDFKAGQKDLHFERLSVLDNPHIPQEEKDKLKAKYEGHPEGPARLYGEFVQRSGMVYPTYNPKVHCIERRVLPREWHRVACIDPAPSGPTGWVRIAFDPHTGDMYVEAEYKQADLIASNHAKNILLKNQGQPVDIWLIDSKGGNQKNAETHRTCADLYRAEGIPVRFPPFDKDFGILALGEYINATLEAAPRHPKVFIFNDLHMIKDEIATYVWDTFMKGNQKGLSKDAPKKGNDDILNCVQYIAGYMKGRKPPARFKPSSVNKPSANLSYT